MAFSTPSPPTTCGRDLTGVDHQGLSVAGIWPEGDGSQ